MSSQKTINVIVPKKLKLLILLSKLVLGFYFTILLHSSHLAASSPFSKFSPLLLHRRRCPPSSAPLQRIAGSSMIVVTDSEDCLHMLKDESFGLDKSSGKKSFMLSVRDLMIVWGDTPRYWKWSNSEHNSRFAEVAELIGVCWLEIRGKIKATMLSPETHYTAYLVYKATVTSYGFDTNPVEVNVGISGTVGGSSKKSLYLDAERLRRERYQIVVRRVGLFGHRHAMAMRPPAPATENDDDDDRHHPNNVNNNNNGVHNPNHPLERQDGWLEIELGDYYNREEEVGDLEISILEVNGGDWKGGLVIQGIDIRPKSK